MVYYIILYNKSSIHAQNIFGFDDPKNSFRFLQSLAETLISLIILYFQIWKSWRRVIWKSHGIVAKIEKVGKWRHRKKN